MHVSSVCDAFILSTSTGSKGQIKYSARKHFVDLLSIYMLRTLLIGSGSKNTRVWQAQKIYCETGKTRALPSTAARLSS